MFLKNQLDMIELGFGTQAFWGFGPILWPSNKGKHYFLNHQNLGYLSRFETTPMVNAW